MKTISFFVIWIVLGLLSFNAEAQEKTKNKGIYETVDEMPVYPGGEKALREFISQNVKYPENAKKEGKTGKVYVSFVIDKKGRVADAKVVKGVCPELDTEALRVIKLISDWTPGKNKGKKVKVAFTIPIQFALS